MTQITREPKTDFQVTDPKRKFRYKAGISADLSFEQVNEVTWKLTDGSYINTPASHGQWPGFRTTRALAWVIDVGIDKPAWVARRKSQCCNPLPLREAKAAAKAMVRGSPGDYLIETPVDHLNGLAARLHERNA